MQTLIETFSKKDTMYRVELGKLNELLKNKRLVVELSTPDLESIKFVEDKHRRFHSIDLHRAAGVLSDFKINEDKSINANFKPSSIYKEMFKETDTPKFGIRCLVKPKFDGSKPIYEIVKLITWDLVDINGS